jgi:hypothetical protein
MVPERIGVQVCSADGYIGEPFLVRGVEIRILDGLDHVLVCDGVHQ